jgi:predicted RNA-binding protein with RPS1 domain
MVCIQYKYTGYSLDFGAFVRFIGLIHIREMPLVYGGTPEASLQTDEHVLARIISRKRSVSA